MVGKRLAISIHFDFRGASIVGHSRSNGASASRWIGVNAAHFGPSATDAELALALRCVAAEAAADEVEWAGADALMKPGAEPGAARALGSPPGNISSAAQIPPRTRYTTL
jgi:hypothetical protein